MGVRYIESEAADDEVLLRGGDRARPGVIACVDSDAENIFIALTARGLRPDILIVARASAEDSEKKLLRAGADRVISPVQDLGLGDGPRRPPPPGRRRGPGGRLPDGGDRGPAGCEGVGKTIEDVRGTSVIVAVRHPDGRLEPQPAPDAVIAAGDMLVAIGTPGRARASGGPFQPLPVPSS